MQISKEQINRYIGQINLKKISIIGQKKLLNSRVLIIGIGGLGTPALNYLARAGVEHFGIVDPDRVSLS
ncbi:MAG: HesA/MoeB/ThiF family protein, partial [Pelagibacteraceae bacterium]|nr:HesA/MoeB/ThiF family protein [Pelagibacteraceae bacterium]